MARQARKLSTTGIYHVIFRGVNRYAIFEEDKDYLKLLQIIIELKEDTKFELYAYCLMSNHVHLLIKEAQLGEISLIMKRMLTKYAGWYNKKYDRCGILISNRFNSEPVETTDYLLTVIRYIHHNPVNAGITSVDKYKWSSFNEYLGQSELVNTDTIFSIINMDLFIKFNYETDYEEEVYDFETKIDKNNIEYIRKWIKGLGIDPDKIGELPKKDRNIVLLNLRNKFSIRQIERATGISRGIISRCK